MAETRFVTDGQKDRRTYGATQFLIMLYLSVKFR